MSSCLSRQLPSHSCPHAQPHHKAQKTFYLRIFGQAFVHVKCMNGDRNTNAPHATAEDFGEILRIKNDVFQIPCSLGLAFTFKPKNRINLFFSIIVGDIWANLKVEQSATSPKPGKPATCGAIWIQCNVHWKPPREFTV